MSIESLNLERFLAFPALLRQCHPMISNQQILSPGWVGWVCYSVIPWEDCGFWWKRQVLDLKPTTGRFRPKRYFPGAVTVGKVWSSSEMLRRWLVIGVSNEVLKTNCEEHTPSYMHPTPHPIWLQNTRSFFFPIFRPGEWGALWHEIWMWSDVAFSPWPMLGVGPKAFPSAHVASPVPW